MASINRKDYEGVVRWVINQKEHLHDESHKLITINSLRNLIFDLKTIWTGYASKAAIKKHNGRISNMTPEHYNPRQRMAEKIVEAVIENRSFDTILELLLDACKIHYVTNEENKKLIPLQRADNYVMEDAYSICKIELVPHTPKRGRKANCVQFRDIVYNSPKEAAKALNVTTQTIRNYCKNENNIEWNYVS